MVFGIALIGRGAGSMISMATRMMEGAPSPLSRSRSPWALEADPFRHKRTVI